MKTISLLCTECLAMNTVPFKRSLLGNPKFTCPRCGKNVVHPLTSGYRGTYIFILVLLVVVAIYAISRGAVPIPGIWAIIAVAGLITDARARKRLKVAQARYDEVHGSVFE